MNRVARHLRALRADHARRPPEYKRSRWLCEAAYCAASFLFVAAACLGDRLWKAMTDLDDRLYPRRLELP